MAPPPRPPQPLTPVARVLILILFLGIAAVFVVTGALRPPSLWNLGKVVTGRRWLGERGMAWAFIGFGAVFGLAGIAIALRKNPPSP